ncbi:MAG: cobalt ECF transporter T component CbiQ, partial [Candidatus Omnitrophica bacterium]|nr:cobalt ECF transporter T component CbiQ [Candidatus Omnitrophota bacterium]
MSLRNKKNNQFIEHSLLKGLALFKDSVFSEEYASRKGFLQSLDPRIKMVTILFFLCATVITKSIFVIISLYAFCLVLAFFSKIPIGFFLKRTWIFIPFFSLFVLLPAIFNVFTPGEALFNLKLGGASLSITRQGVCAVSLVAARIVSAVSFAILLSLTTRHT